MNLAYHTVDVPIPCDVPNKDRASLLLEIDTKTLSDDLKDKIIRRAIAASDSARYFLYYEMPHTQMEIDMWKEEILLMQAIDEIPVM